MSDTQNPPIPILRLCIFYSWGIFPSRPPSPSNHQAFSSSYTPRSTTLSNQLLLSSSIIASPTLDRHSFESASSVFIDHRLINPRSSLFRTSFFCLYQLSPHQSSTATLSNLLLLFLSIIVSSILDRHSFESASSVFIDHRLTNSRISETSVEIHSFKHYITDLNNELAYRQPVLAVARFPFRTIHRTTS